VTVLVKFDPFPNIIWKRMKLDNLNVVHTQSTVGTNKLKQGTVESNEPFISQTGGDSSKNGTRKGHR